MSVNSATVQGESYVYGGVLFQRVTEADVVDRSDRTGIGTCLSQGLLTTAVVMFLIFVISALLLSDEGFTFSAAIFFSVVLCFSMVPGFIQALAIGLCIKLAGHDLRWFTRALIGALAFALFDVALILVFGSSRSLTENLKVFGILSAAGAITGLVTGSRLRFGRELVRSADEVPPQSWFLAGLSGLVLRLAISLFLMESILFLIAWSHSRSQQGESVIALLVLVHFIAAFAVAFARLRFWFLLPLALLINFPIAAFFADMLKELHVFLFYLCMGYLGAWATFLISRCALTYRMLAFLKEEAKYYLID